MKPTVLRLGALQNQLGGWLKYRQLGPASNAFNSVSQLGPQNTHHKHAREPVRLTWGPHSEPLTRW